ncbi:MAG: DNA polymerase Y family protein [Candidatus Brocadiia bacterium]
MAPIMHVDIDAFFASVEQVKNPALRGRPVAVGSGCIASCSYQARQYGLEAGMPLRRARQLCPNLVVLEGHYPTYRSFAQDVFQHCRQLSPRVETYLDEACCDLNGTERMLGDPLEAGKRLKRDVKTATGLSVTVGIGPNIMIAALAGSGVKPDGIRRINDEEKEQFIRDMNVEKLPGVGRSRGDELRKLNIHTAGDMRRLDRQSLRNMFGKDGEKLHNRCRGRDHRRVGESPLPTSISRQTTFRSDTTDQTRIKGMLDYLTGRATRALRRRRLRAGALTVWIRYSDSRSRRKRIRMNPPADEDTRIGREARNLLQTIYSRRAQIHATGLELTDLAHGDGRQKALFDGGQGDRKRALYAHMDELRDKFGHSVLVSGTEMLGCGDLRRDRYGFVLRTPSLTK